MGELTSQPDLLVSHNPSSNRFEIDLGDSVAILEYEIRDNEILFLHTETPPKHEGKGIGSRLARAGLDYARDYHYRVVPLCSFIAVYISRHPEYQSLLAK